MGKAKQRKASSRSKGVLDRATNALHRMGRANNPLIRSDLPQEEKISHALTTLLTLAVPEDSPLAEYKAALNFVVLSWNISLLAPDEQSEALQKFPATRIGTTDAMRRAALNHIERLIARKQMLFPHDKRTILSWDVWFEGGNIRVSAAAICR